MRKLMGFVFAGLFLTTAVAAKADTFTPTNPTGVDYSMLVGPSFYVSNTGLPEAFNDGTNFWEVAAAPGGDAGIVMYFNGGLTLGELQSVTVTTDNAAAMNVNLWLDTSGDGQFFSFSGGVFQGTAGDGYCGITGTTVTGISACTPLGGVSTQDDTLAQLQAGDIAGINGSTPVALWIGVNSPGVATISSVDVVTTPEPSSLMLLGTGFLGLVGVARRKLA